MPEKAIDYLRRAGETAVRLSAFEEGIAHLNRGLELLATLTDTTAADRRSERVRQELAIQLALGIAQLGRRAYGPEAEQAYTRARELCRQLGETTQLCLVLGRLSILHYTRSEHQRARELAEEALVLAQEARDPLLVALGHRYLGCILLCLGDYTSARAHLGQMISFYEPQQHHRTLVLVRGSDAGTSALAYDASCLWCLGYPDQALERGQEAMALARELGHPWSLADVLWYGGCLRSELLRDVPALEGYTDELMRLAQEKVPAWLGGATCYQGVALAMRGQVEEGIALIRQGMAAYPPGMRFYSAWRLSALAEAQAKAEHQEEALATLAEAQAFVKETNERHWEAELHRVKGQLLLAQGHQDDAEASFHEAIAVARRQSAKSWELRATVSLARLWEQKGKREEARQRLTEIYGWFTEGFDTPDLVEAKTLLEQLSV
jgi:predicted ATPase